MRLDDLVEEREEFLEDLDRLLREGLVMIDVDDALDDQVARFRPTARGMAEARALAALDPVDGGVAEVHAR